MEKRVFTVESGDSGQRLDIFLAQRFPKPFSRSRVQRLIKEGMVLVNGAAKKSRYKVEKGDHIEADVAGPKKLDLKPERIPLEILYEDSRVIVINKPAGMVVHPAPGNYTGTLVNALLYHTGKLSNADMERPGIVHRLDKGTSGLIVVAKDEEAHAFLARQFSRRTANKTYLAVVEGVVQLDNGTISYPIGRSVRDRKKMAVRFTEAKEAVTSYHVIERFSDSTLVKIRPKTGRTHQIRVHMAYIGHPIVCDKAYGSRKKCAFISRQALHAEEISFVHPDTKKAVWFSAPMPADMEALILQLRNKS